MKKLFLKSGVFIVVFVLTLIVTGKYMNRGNNDMTMKMAAATLPVVTFWQGDIAVNELHGHTVKMDVSTMASTIVQLGEQREVSFVVDTYDEILTSVSLEVRSCDGGRLIEKIENTEFNKTDERIRVDAVLKDLLEKDTEYALVVVLTNEEGRESRYYTRCIWGDGYKAEEKASFVKDFYETTFDKEAAVDLKKYLESNASGDNTTLHKVNIHSSFQQVTWGELGVSQVMEPVIDILELGRDTGAFRLKSMVASGSKGDSTYYMVEEYYRIRYTTSRVYLLDFERKMTQLPDIEGNIYANDKIMLGIVGNEIQLAESEDGNYLVFEVAGKLCSYNVKDNKMSVLYTFYDAENKDVRTLYDAHEMKILDIDDLGNVKFAVYGYFNRGRHEGQTGISVFSYDSSLNCIEELVHIPYEKSWEILKCDVEKLCYLSSLGKFYVYLNQGIHEMNMETWEDTELVRLSAEDTMYTSANHQIVLWKQGDSLQILNLETEKRSEISAKADESMCAMGFIGNDIIYGAVQDIDIVEDAAGKEILPMYMVAICDDSGKMLKEYREENVYTISVEVIDNQITLNRVKRTGDGGYVETVPEHIVNNEQKTTGKNKIVTAAIDVYETITQIQVRKNIDSKSIQILTPKELIFEGDREVEVSVAEDAHKQYYVYNRYGMDEVYFQPGAAVLLAYDTSGRVVDETGRTVWFKGNRVARNQILAITEPEKVRAEESLAVCLNTIMKFEGITASSKPMLEEGKGALEILQEQLMHAQVADMTGCTMDAMLYFVNKDIPVLAILADGEAVLITGFNEFNIVVFEPSTGKLYKKGLNDSAKWFEENGNRFITYFKED